MVYGIVDVLVVHAAELLHTCMYIVEYLLTVSIAVADV
jgi:hypothetical protein